MKSPVSKDPSKGTAAGFATPKADDNDMDERITVVERSTKKVIAGVMAPTRANIFQWVEEHPTFEVFRPSKLELDVEFYVYLMVGWEMEVIDQSIHQSANQIQSQSIIKRINESVNESANE